MYQNCPKAVKPQKKIGTNWNFGVSQGFVPIFVPIPQEKSSPAAPFSPRLVKIQENPSGSLLTGQNTLKTGGEDGKSEFSSSRGEKNWIFLRQGEKILDFPQGFPTPPHSLAPKISPNRGIFVLFRSCSINPPAQPWPLCLLQEITPKIRISGVLFWLLAAIAADLTVPND